MTSEPDKGRMVGMAGGTLWLVAVSSFFAILSLSWIGVGTLPTKGVLAVVILLTAAGIGATIRVMRMAFRLPNDAPDRTDDGRTMMRRFWVIVIAEVVAIMVVNALCVTYGQSNLMAPLDLIVVGLHFVALARLFRVPRYTVVGWLFCALPIVTLLLVPEQTLVGRAPAWFVLPSLSCTLVVWLAAAANLHEIRRGVGHA